MSLNTIKTMIDAQQEGGCHSSFIYKSSVPNPSAGGYWIDMSMGGGKPIYNAYVGSQLEATQFIGSKNVGINTGPSLPEVQQKHLVQMGLISMTTTNGPPMTVLACDYLLYYPLVDGDSVDLQEMDNAAPLPRYQDGYGVQAFLVITTPMANSGGVTINYTDSDGMDRSVYMAIISHTVPGVIIGNGSNSPYAGSKTCFVPINSKGIRRINSVQNSSAMGGYYAIVLVKPLTSMALAEGAVYTEHCLISNKLQLPRIYDGAYINMIALLSGSGNPAPIWGQFDFVYG